jgi:hypothetical protein
MIFSLVWEFDALLYNLSLLYIIILRAPIAKDPMIDITKFQL